MKTRDEMRAKLENYLESQCGTIVNGIKYYLELSDELVDGILDALDLPDGACDMELDVDGHVDSRGIGRAPIGESKAKELIAAIKKREQKYKSALEQLIDVSDNDFEATDSAQALSEAIELVACLRRALPSLGVATIRRAFGAPGDFGYESAIGAALSTTYRPIERF